MLIFRQSNYADYSKATPEKMLSLQKKNGMTGQVPSQHRENL